MTTTTPRSRDALPAWEPTRYEIAIHTATEHHVIGYTARVTRETIRAFLVPWFHEHPAEWETIMGDRTLTYSSRARRFADSTGWIGATGRTEREAASQPEGRGWETPPGLEEDR